VLTELIGGGAERSMLSIIDALDRRRFTPTLILFSDRRDHEPPADVPIVVLSGRAPFGVVRTASRIRELARVVKRERIDLLVSFLIGPNVVSVAAARLAGVPVIIGERSAPQTVLSDANPQLRARGLWSRLVPMYPRVAHHHQHQRRPNRIGELSNAPASRVTVIPNAFDLERVTALATEPLDAGVVWPPDPVLVHVGRFTHAKDHDTLLTAFATIRSHRSAARYWWATARRGARAREAPSSVSPDVISPASRAIRIDIWLARRSSVLTSRFEGLPNALIESMALGVPIVSTACQFGARGDPRRQRVRRADPGRRRRRVRRRRRSADRRSPSTQRAVATRTRAGGRLRPPARRSHVTDPVRPHGRTATAGRFERQSSHATSMTIAAYS
jgi:glycosyltransferase involved in cell wall biosynthesis